ncbi:hypothetical protein V5799_025491 [Amblyomma americanum]|uniref:SAM-dependent methyltransferase RsmB-F/NOP2-type catalytic core domain-containing protein n=1 Tax=Amblyomma americanum TaxID=6943 RepID=A0AAQ4E941_AMBAM
MPGGASSSLLSFVPSSRLVFQEEQVGEDAYQGFYRPDSQLRLPMKQWLPEGEDALFPGRLDAALFGTGDISTFPVPRRTGTPRLLNCYHLDGASLLPVLALDLQKGDDVADLCAAPGGKLLATLFSGLAGSAVACDASLSRVQRLRECLQSYLPKKQLQDVSVLQRDLLLPNSLAQHSFDKALAALLCGPVPPRGCDPVATSFDLVNEPSHRGKERWPSACASRAIDVDVFSELASENLARARCPAITLLSVPQLTAHHFISTTVTSHHMALQAPLKERATSTFFSGQASSSIGNMLSNHFCLALQVLAALLCGPVPPRGCDPVATSFDLVNEPSHRGKERWPSACASRAIDVDVFSEPASENLARARCPAITLLSVPQLTTHRFISTTVTSHHMAQQAPLKERATSTFFSGQASSSIGNMLSNHFCLALQLFEVYRKYRRSVDFFQGSGYGVY